MDYGSAIASNCTVVGGVCEMGQSSVAAAEDLHGNWGVPYNQIEITPMIGGNDTQGETFTLADVGTVSSYAKQKGIAGVHFCHLIGTMTARRAGRPQPATAMARPQAGIYDAIPLGPGALVFGRDPAGPKPGPGTSSFLRPCTGEWMRPCLSAARAGHVTGALHEPR